MPSDFGDESGEKLFDWMLKLGQDAGEAALVSGAERLKAAFANARGELGAGAGDAPAHDGWAKLKLAEFEALPEFETIRQAIDGKLDASAVEHDFFTDKDGKGYLLFRLDQAPAVSAAFAELEEQTQGACERAVSALKEQVPGKERAEAREAKRGPAKPKKADLSAPATERQMAYLSSLRAQFVIPEEEYAEVAGEAPTIGAANKLLNKYGHFLNLGADEPLAQRAERARAGAKAINAPSNRICEMELSQARAK